MVAQRRPSSDIGVTLANHGVLVFDELAEFIAPVVPLRGPPRCRSRGGQGSGA